MSLEIDSKSTDKLTTMLREFAGNFEYADANERIIFVNYFMNALNDCNLELDDNIKTFNTFVGHIANYEISLMDVFDILGTAEITDLITVASAFNSAYDSGILTADSSLETFELFKSNESIMDILKSAKKPTFTINEIYFKPVIDYGFGEDSEKGYKNMLNALRAFYNESSVKSAIEAEVSISSENIELSDFIAYVKQSYIDKNFILLQSGGNRPKLDILNFILSFNGRSTYLSETFAEYITHNKAKEACNELYRKCIKYYLADINTYKNRNKQFNLLECLYVNPNATRPEIRINIDDIKDIKISTLPYNMLLGLLYNKETYFDDYFDDLSSVKKTYITNIQSAVKTAFGDKFILGV